MITSATGRQFIEAFEGRFLKTYDDGTGVLTIGYGHTTAAGPPKVVRGMTINDDECDKILSDDLRSVEIDVGKFVRVPLTQPQFDALVSFHFNTGALGRGTIAAKINANHPALAMETLLLYDHAGGRQMAGLTRRRKAERLLFEGNVQSALAVAGVHQASGQVMPQAPQAKPVPAPIPDVPPIQPQPYNTLAAIIAFVVGLFRRK